MNCHPQASLQPKFDNPKAPIEPLKAAEHHQLTPHTHSLASCIHSQFILILEKNKTKQDFEYPNKWKNIR